MVWYDVICCGLVYYIVLYGMVIWYGLIRTVANIPRQFGHANLNHYHYSVL